MRLLLTADAVGGVWQYALELAAALPEDVVVTLAVLGPAPDDAQRAAAAAIPRLRLVETGLPLDWLCDGPAPVLAAGAAIARLARDEGAEIVHLNMPSLAAAGGFAVPVLAVDHGTLAPWWEAARGVAVDAGLAWHPELTARGLRAASRVVAPTRAHAEAVARCYALPEAPEVIHNGRSPRPAPAAARFHGALAIGRLWDEVKGTPTLDDAAALLGAPFVAIGATRAPHGGAAAPAHLHATGPLPDAALAGWLARRPVFVSAARFEPFGLAVLEAAQAGCPLVLSDIPGFRELWDGAAAFVRPDDAAGFAAAIGALLADEAAFEAASAAARARAARYTPRVMARRTDALYRQLLRRPGDGEGRRAA